MQLYHFSEEGDIALFTPRPPLRQPDAEPFVYAIDAWHSPLYLFPRDCPRIGVWDDEGESQIFIDESWLERWLQATIFRYDLPPDSFADCSDHGVWVSKAEVRPIGLDRLTNLPDLCPWPVQVVPSLTAKAKELYDFGTRQFLYQGHVSMIRMSNLPDWPLGPGIPVSPK